MAKGEVRRIELDGTAWIEADEGVEVPVRLVMGRGGVLGVKRIEEHEALGLDQVGHQPVPPPPPSAPRATSRVDKGHFDTSDLDQM